MINSVIFNTHPFLSDNDVDGVISNRESEQQLMQEY